MSKKTVLIIDDSMYMRTLINDVLSGADYEVVGQAATGEAGIDLAFELKPDLITLDNILPDMIGLDILRVVKKEGLNSKVVMVSAVGQQSVIDEGMELGAERYIVKPFTSEDLLKIVGEVFAE